MKKINLRVKDSERSWTGRVRREIASSLIATLSADPHNLEELCNASARFIDPVRLPKGLKEAAKTRTDAPASSHAPGPVTREHSVNSNEESNAHRAAGPRSDVCLDLSRFTVICPQGEKAAKGDVPYLGPTGRHGSIAYSLHDRWLVGKDEAQVERWLNSESRQEFARHKLPLRDVLYGPPMLQFVVTSSEQLIAKIGRSAADQHRAIRRRAAGKQMTDEQRKADRRFWDAKALEPDYQAGIWDGCTPDTRYQIAADVHAAWWVHSLDQFGGATVQQLITRDLFHVDGDLARRSDQWLAFDVQPAALRASDWAYRHMSFGTHEVSVYFSLVRFLILKYINERCKVASKLPDDVDMRVKWLHIQQELWLDEPDAEEPTPLTPRHIIESERLRIPLAEEPGIFDCDCPLCHMLADDVKLVFICFDGHHMEQVYPFSLDDWEESAEQRAEIDAVLRDGPVELIAAKVLNDPNPEWTNEDIAEGFRVTPAIAEKHRREPIEDSSFYGTRFMDSCFRKSRNTSDPSTYHVMMPLPPGFSSKEEQTNRDLSEDDRWAHEDLEDLPDRPDNASLMERLIEYRNEKVERDVEDLEATRKRSARDNAAQQESDRANFGFPGEFSSSFAEDHRDGAGERTMDRLVDRFSVAAATGDLIDEIKRKTNDRTWVQLLLRHVGNFVSVIGDVEQHELHSPVAHRFCDVLGDLSEELPELAPKIEELQDKVLRMTEFDR